MEVHNNIIANYVGRAYSIAVIYLFVPFYVRVLGVESYGVIAAYTILLTLSGLADIGLSATFAREAARSSDGKKLLDLLSTIERILFLSASLLSLIIFVCAEFIAARWLNTSGTIDEQTVIYSFRLMALMIVPQLGISLYSAGLIGLQKQVKANLIQSLFTTIRSGLVVLPILWRPELPLFFIWQLVTTAAFALVTRVFLLKAMGFPGLQIGRFDYAMLRSNLIFAGGMLWISIVSGINTQIDKLLVSKLFSLTDFGYYNLASTLAQVPVVLVTPIAVVFYPYITAHVAKQNVDQERLAFEAFGQWIAFIGALSAFGVALYAPELLALWLQDQKLQPVVANVSTALAIGSLFLCLNIPSYYHGLAHGQSGLIATLVTMTLLFSLPLTILAARIWGLFGVAFPWIALNLINLLLMSTMITGRHLGQYSLGRIIRTLASPVVFALFPILGARFITHAFEAPPLLSCIVAGVGGLCAVLAFMASRHTGIVSGLIRKLWRRTI